MDLILGGETETPHAVEKLSLRAATAESLGLDPVLLHKRNHLNEKPVHHNKD